MKRQVSFWWLVFNVLFMLFLHSTMRDHFHIDVVVCMRGKLTEIVNDSVARMMAYVKFEMGMRVLTPNSNVRCQN